MTTHAKATYDREQIRRKALHVWGGGLDASLGKDCLDLLTELEQAEQSCRVSTHAKATKSAGPASEWFCLCWNYLRHRKLNPATKPRCEQCGMERP